MRPVTSSTPVELLSARDRNLLLGYYHARDSLIESQRWPPLRYAGLASHFANGNALEWRNSCSWTNPALIEAANAYGCGVVMAFCSLLSELAAEPVQAVTWNLIHWAATVQASRADWLKLWRGE
jgi:hypothetical protein